MENQGGREGSDNDSEDSEVPTLDGWDEFDYDSESSYDSYVSVLDHQGWGNFRRWLRSGTSTAAPPGTAYVSAPAQNVEGRDTILRASGNLVYIHLAASGSCTTSTMRHPLSSSETGTNE